MFSHFTQVNPQNQSPHKPKHTPNQSSTTTFIPWHSLIQSLQTHSRWWFNWPFTHTFCHYHRCMLSYHQLNNTTNQHSHQNSSNKSMPKHRICKEHTHTHTHTWTHTWRTPTPRHNMQKYICSIHTHRVSLGPLWIRLNTTDIDFIVVGKKWTWCVQHVSFIKHFGHSFGC